MYGRVSKTSQPLTPHPPLRRRGAPNKSASSPLSLIIDLCAVDYLPDLPEAPRARRPTGWRALTLSAPNSRTAPRQAADVHAEIKSAPLPIVLITDVSGPRHPNNPQEAPASDSGTSGHERASIPPSSLMRGGAPPHSAGGSAVLAPAVFAPRPVVAAQDPPWPLRTGRGSPRRPRGKVG